MKKLYRTILTAVMAIFTVSTNAQVQEIVLDVVDPDVSSKEVWNIYDNEDYRIYFDIVKNLPLSDTKTYTLDDLNTKYSYIYSKNEIVVNDYGTKQWKKYEYTSVSCKIGKNNVLEATVEAKNGNDVINAKFIYTNPSKINITLTGECEYIADQKIYAVTAMNKGSELKEDYSVSLGIKAAAFANGKVTAADLSTYGNKIKVAAGEDISIKNATLTIESNGDSQIIKGDITGSDSKKYYIEITTNVPSTDEKTVEIDLGAVLEITTDEGDVKLKAEDGSHQFIGFITSKTTDVPSGKYSLLSYTKYGVKNEFGFYSSDAVENGQIEVLNNNGNISITATFKQNGKNYSVKASNFTTSLATASQSSAKATAKYLENGKIVLLHNGKKYSANAQQMK